ncbi:type VI secretion system-associated FHA domain protein TagH [Loktanella agnita]|uniref:type VI secretion system-associated FHA domain protein TagH n=1 Tax=Loktanella agnita TaxID=287097 RepID=UPI0039871D01
MTLTLQIENYDKLPDGGPTSATVTGTGMSVGRSSSMDWTLPDPQRHISGHHFDISFRDGAYFLTDVSTNGIFLDGQRHRLEGAYQLKQGDRFQVGNYFIGVRLGDGSPAAPAQHAAPLPTPTPAFDDSDPWAVDAAPSAPINPNPRPSTDAFADFASEFIVNPAAPPTPPAPPVPEAAPIPAAPSPFGGSDSPFPADPAPLPMPDLPRPALSPTPSAAPAPQPPTSAPVPTDNSQAVLDAFYAGAGLSPPTSDATADPVALAHDLGQTMRVAATELMALLQDRAAAKQFTRSGDRTMMGASDNNPLKFLPDATQALEVMFVQPRDGFLRGGESIGAALTDVKLHQMAVFAALQPALIKLLADLAPEAIEEAAGGGLLAGGRRKAWDEFVKRWDAKVADHENGMLDVFLKHFAESYTAAVAAARR